MATGSTLLRVARHWGAGAIVQRRLRRGAGALAGRRRAGRERRTLRGAGGGGVCRGGRNTVSGVEGEARRSSHTHRSCSDGRARYPAECRGPRLATCVEVGSCAARFALCFPVSTSSEVGPPPTAPVRCGETASEEAVARLVCRMNRAVRPARYS